MKMYLPTRISTSRQVHISSAARGEFNWIAFLSGVIAASALCSAARRAGEKALLPSCYHRGPMGLEDLFFLSAPSSQSW